MSPNFSINSNPSRCVANANKIIEFPWITPANLQRAIQKEPNADEIVMIINLPISVDQVI